MGAPRIDRRRSRRPRVRGGWRPRPPAWSADGRGTPCAGSRDPPGARAVISRRRVGLASAVVAGGLAVAALLGLVTGPAAISPADVAAVLVGRPPSDLASTVVLELRLPRVLLAALAGGGLAVAGAAFQALTRNPLADPAVLGVAGGAALGAVLGHLGRFGGSLAATVGLS